MLPPAAVIFDLDGTLIDSRGDIVAAVNFALTKIGKSPLPASVVVGFVGDGARALCARAGRFPEASDEVDTLVGHFLTYYTEHPVEHSRWTPGAPQALDALAEMQVPLGLCTNKPRVTTDAVLYALGIRTRFRAVVAGGDLSEKKPAPGPLLLAAKMLGLPPDRCVMVGDGHQDIECARRAGMRSIGIESGLSNRRRLLEARPDVLLANLGELVEVIRRWRDATVRVSPAH